MDISLIASSVRPHLWKECLDSLKSNSCEYEVVFAGNLDREVVMPFLKEYRQLRYIFTGNIKPAQCYEVARRAAKGKLIMWIADDCEFSPGLLDHVVDRFGRSLGFKTLLSIRTNENKQDNVLDDHRFFDGFQDPEHSSPLMAPLGCMEAEYLEDLGGFDRRYLCGQYENDVAMRVYADNGKVVKHESDVVHIEHIRKHGASTKFWSGYDHDRKILEDTWAIGGYVQPIKQYADPYKLTGNISMLPPNLEGDEQTLKEIRLAIKGATILSNTPRLIKPKFDRKVSMTPLLPFEPYDHIDLLTKSQSHKGSWC